MREYLFKFFCLEIKPKTNTTLQFFLKSIKYI